MMTGSRSKFMKTQNKTARSTIVQPENFNIDIRNIPPGALNQKGICRYLPDLPDDFSEQNICDLLDANCLSDKGFHNGELTKNGILQICLLKTEPFNFKGSLTEYKNRILDVRNGQKRQCQNRPKLLEYFAATLVVDYHRYLRLSANIEGKLEARKREFDKLRGLLSAYFDLRSKGVITSRKGVKHFQKRTVNKAYQTIQEVLQSITESDYEQISEYQYEHFTPRLKDYISKDYKGPSIEETPLLTRWCDSFILYGPKRYPLDATLHAVASILITFII
jgi:hypothetical protein